MRSFQRIDLHRIRESFKSFDMVQTRSMLKHRRRSASPPSSAEAEPLISHDCANDANDDDDDTKKTRKASYNRLPPPSDSNRTGLRSLLNTFGLVDNNRSFRVTKGVMLRLLGIVYFFAFLGAYHQNVALMGSDGLVPAQSFMYAMRSRFPDSNISGFMAQPTLFWWIPLTDATLDGFAIVGLGLSSLVVFGIDSWLLLLLLWIIDFSIVTVAGGGSFYSYGWESQLLETGFIAIFLCDLPSITKIRDRPSGEWRWSIRAIWRDDKSKGQAVNEPSTAALWLMRWLCFRISMGAGLIKIRGGSCWKLKTCLLYHFSTQPIPSPMSFVFHFLPKSLLKRAVDLDLFVQLYSSWMVLIPGMIGRIGGIIQAAFMVNIIISGNFAFLNHLTIIPSLACLDDDCWPRWITRWVVGRRPDQVRTPPEENETPKKIATVFRLAIDLSFVGLIGYLSIPVVANLLQWGGSRQQMNASFNNFRLVNTYGAFGSVGQARYEPIVSVSLDGKEWQEIEFPCKPGDLKRRPCFCAPYHYRVDWNIWFLGFKPHEQMLRSRETWLFGLLSKILSGKKGEWLNLLDKSAESVLFGGENGALAAPVKYVKVDMYRYRMAAPLWRLIPKMIMREEDFAWWERSYEESLIPRIILDKESGALRNVPF